MSKERKESLNSALESIQEYLKDHPAHELLSLLKEDSEREQQRDERFFTLMESVFPKFYQNIFEFGSTYLHSASTVPSIMSKFLWFNRNIKVENRPIFFKHFTEKTKKMAK